MDSSGSGGLQNTLCQVPAAVADSAHSCPHPAMDRTNEGSNSVPHFEGSSHSSGSSSTAIYFNTFPSGEGSGNRSVSPCHQSKGPEQVPTQGEVQNGGAPHCSLSAPQRQLHDEARPARRLFCSSYSSGLQEVPPLPVRGNNFRIQLSAIRPLAGPWGFQQNCANYRSPSALGRSTDHLLLGRPSSASSPEGDINGDFPLCAEVAVQPRLCGEIREVFTSPNSPPNIPGYGNRLISDVQLSSRGTDRSNIDSMSGNGRGPVNSTGGVDKFIGPHESCSSDRAVAGPLTLQSPATSTRPSTTPGSMEAEVSDVIVSTFPGGSHMVVVSNSPLPQQAGHYTSPLQPHSEDQRIFAGVGCNLRWQDNWGMMGDRIGKAAHQLPGAHSGVASIAVIPETGGTITIPEPARYASHSPGDGQHHCSRICEQKGGGGTQSPTLSLLALDLWSLVLARGSWVTARHPPGV